ncbi:hypothetical protein B0H65DRAFT_519767 [Neurospora tetraspora]|uniref:Uncharacterized protein n=1 Tax=Neurospora tetraspora TaxID=94610 RepID=A0AAE0JKT0_9PEZI|nr:hypothetical protein B0H65DRAFT_519767 [Neurospora tetraspora]
MLGPLSPMPSSVLNLSTPISNHRQEIPDIMDMDLDDAPSRRNNTQQTTAGDNVDNSESSEAGNTTSPPIGRDPSPPKSARPMSRIISGNELSPLKILQHQPQQQPLQVPESAESPLSPAAKSMAPPPLPQSARKTPIKRFPVKINPSLPGSEETTRSSSRDSQDRHRISLQDVIRENGGIKQAIDIFEDDDVDMTGIEGDSGPKDTLLQNTSGNNTGGEHEHATHEDSVCEGNDTMVSTFSTFSAVPDLTKFSHMRSESASRFSVLGGGVSPTKQTPRANGLVPDNRTTTGKKRDFDSGNTSNLLDFTDSLRYGGYGAPQTSPTRRTQFASPRPGSTDPPTTTPQRPGSNLSNILDFDIPPMPTPRSVPTITPRELETLKSGFLSEISSLKASLSGKEAEVTSLKTAVSDAEKRVGECMERLHEVESMHESLETEKNTWERRGREMETVLRQVKEEIVLGQREREELEFKLDEAEKRREAAEMMAQDAESKMAGMRAGQPSSNKEVEMAVERVARELHALYKSKHETKVAALKKSYESRWEKKVRDLQAQVDELSRENEELRKQRDQDKAALATLNPARLTELEEERKADRARNAVQITEFEAEVEKLVAILQTVKDDNDELRTLLEQERIEKGELVRLAEEMMSMQQEPPTPAPAPAPTHLSTANGRGLSDRRVSDMSATSNGDGGHHAPQPASMTSKIGAKPRLGLGGGPGAVRAPTKTQSASGIAPPSGMEGAFRAGGVGRPTSMRAPGGSGLGLKASAASRIGLGGGSGHGRAQSATASGPNGVSGLPRPGSGMGLRGSGTLGGGTTGFGGTGGYRGH